MDEIMLLAPYLKGAKPAEPIKGQAMNNMEAMTLALAEAYKGFASVSPNPLVGCVILDSQSRFLSKGYHQVFGGPHAEANALKNLSESDLKGAHVFVTLEPCAHEGKTPSCAKALAKLPIKAVTYGLQDPNPLVAGQGAKILESAGINAQIFSGSESIQQELEEVCEHFLWNYRHKKTFVSLKVASSLDGFMGLSNGESKWITSEESREMSHVLRASHDALLVGRGTLLADNPKLNIRHPQVQKTQKIIVLDSNGIALSKLNELDLLKHHDPKNVYFVISDKHKDVLNPAQVNLIHAPLEAGLLNLKNILEQLWGLEIKSVFVEGGAKVLSSFISEGLAQRLYLFQAPILLGGKAGRSWSEQLKIETMSSKISLKNQKVTKLQTDTLFTGKLV